MLANKLLIVLLAVSASACCESYFCAIRAHDFPLHNKTDCLFCENCKQIQFLDEIYILENTLSFSHRINLSLLGMDESRTTIKCTQDTGVTFTNITNLTLRYITFKGCGHAVHALNVNFSVAVLITECNTLSISNMRIMESNGTGLAMQNVAGVIAISDSCFKGNHVSSPNSSGGGGVYLELKEEEESTHQSCDIAEYDFDNCLFIENKATVTNPFLNCDDRQFTGVGHGGAISIRLQSYPCHVKGTQGFWMSCFSKIT